MCFSVLLLVATVVEATSERIFLPSPEGQYHVGKTQLVLNHTTYNDVIAPPGSDNTGSFILLTVTYPTLQAPTEETSLQYMDAELASQIESGWGFPNGSLEKLWTNVQWQPPMLDTSNGLPTLLFSPGAGMPCLSGTAVQSKLASKGYTVLCTDHPGEAPYLKLPSGGGVYGIPIDDSWESIDQLVGVNENRKSDFDFLLSAWPKLVDEMAAPFNKTTYLHFGSSMGGSIGTDVVSRHESVLAGVDFDGAFIDTLFGNTVDVKKPFLMLEDIRERHVEDWKQFQGNQTGWWEELQILGCHHLDFSDVGLWVELLDLEDQVPGIVLGGIKGTRIQEIIMELTSNFFDWVLGKTYCFWDVTLPSEEWSEVQFMNSSSGVPDCER